MHICTYVQHTALKCVQRWGNIQKSGILLQASNFLLPTSCYQSVSVAMYNFAAVVLCMFGLGLLLFGGLDLFLSDERLSWVTIVCEFAQPFRNYEVASMSGPSRYHF